VVLSTGRGQERVIPLNRKCPFMISAYGPGGSPDDASVVVEPVYMDEL